MPGVAQTKGLFVPRNQVVSADGPQREYAMASNSCLIRTQGIACLIALAVLLAGCSGSSSTASTGGGNAPAIQGVATPSSVSVVTAN